MLLEFFGKILYGYRSIWYKILSFQLHTLAYVWYTYFYFFIFQVSRQSLDVVVEVAKKEEMFVQCKSGGLEKVKVADSSVDERALTSEQAVTIAQLMMELEQKMKRPQDFEWGIQDG